MALDHPKSDVQKTANHYNSEAHGYEIWTGKRQGGYHIGSAKSFWDIFDNSKMVQQASELMIDTLGITSTTKTILDAGCGAGDVARMIKERYPRSDLQVQGVTLSKEQIAIGQKRLDTKKISGVVLHQENFEQLSFPDSSFDIVFFMESICYGGGRDKRAALTEASRVLKPGGRMVIADGFTQKHFSEWNNWHQRFDKKIRREWAIPEWVVEKDFLKTAGELGFTKVKEKDLSKKNFPSLFHLIFALVPVTLFGPIFRLLHVFSKRELRVIRIVSFSLIMNLTNRNSLYKLMVFEKDPSDRLRNQNS